MKGLVLAAGHGTRLRPLTLTGNKTMLPVANKPLLFYSIEALVKAGIKEIFIVLGRSKDDVRAAIGDGSKFGAKVEYIEQREAKGLAHAVLISEPYIGHEPFVMFLGDNLLREGAKPVVESFMENGTDCAIVVKPVNNPSSYGIAEMEGGKIKKLLEKPSRPKSNLAVAGLYAFNESVFEAVKNIKPSWRNELEIVDAVQYLIDHGKNVKVRFLRDWWKDAGKPDDLLEANQLVLRDLPARIEGVIENDSCVARNVSVGRGTIIRSSMVRGPSVIGNNCSIDSDSYVGPYTSIGDGCKITGCEIENSIIMENVTIDCKRRIVNSIIGKGSNITSIANQESQGFRLVVGDVCQVVL